ncbi:uncharacterized protein BJX67DRAFT_381048 [Aspergillus lucknowensis]|uniref:Uncharacterized protein n=1 Tax=Aspergillus lucknowensis TaxID=176173 RepID=A0ABR4LS11_9EURO
MNDQFHWGLDGLNGQKFRAYTALLHLRNGGQGDPDWEAELARNDMESAGEQGDDGETAIAQGLSDFDEPRLKRALLDRIAELVSNIRNGKHVAATMLVEAQERCTVFVSKNNGFDRSDKQFLKALESSLREISRSETFEFGDAKLNLWDRLIDHYQPRLQDWASSLRQSLKRYNENQKPNRQQPTLNSQQPQQPLDLLTDTLQRPGLIDKDQTMAQYMLSE